MDPTVRQAWREAWKDPRLRAQLVVAPLVLVLLLHGLARFLVWIEARAGVRLVDPVLPLVAPRDETWLVFGLIYVAIVVTLADVWRSPRWLVIGVQAYAVMILARMAAMYVTPLEPPADMVALRDPLIERLGTGTLLTRDLFFSGHFSGHTSTVFLMSLVARGRRVAPPFAYASFHAVQWGHRRWGVLA